jgi:OOP family OmpA-OmpF porin
MKTSHKPLMRGLVLSQAVLLSAVGLAGCGGVTVFQDQTPVAVMGTLPPPPPAPEPEPEPEPPPRVELKEDRIQINEKIQFEYNSAKILEVSHSLLNEVADVIKKTPRIKTIQIEGHASSDGADDYNLKLSDRRAKAVRTYLLTQGVAPETLVAKGFGETKPIADNNTEAGREKNRRVEFNILKQEVIQKKVQIDPKTGKETVLEQKTVSEGGNAAAVKKPAAGAAK